LAEHVVVVLVLIAVCGGYYLVPLIAGVVAWRLWSNQSDAAAWTVLALLAASAAWPTRNIPSLRRAWVLQCVAKYFAFRWIDDSGQGISDLGDPSRDKRFLAVWFPHGIIPLGCFLAASEFDTRLPGYFGRMAVAPALLRVPLLRQLFGSFGAIPNDRRSMLGALGRGEHLSLFPGGIAELFLSSRQREAVYLTKRKGFVKMALQTGTSILPIYVFGHTQMFDQVSDLEFMARVSRFLRTSITVFWGRWCLPLPHRVPVTMARGKPIHVLERIKDPSKEQIEELHAKVVAEVKKLYERHKAAAGPAFATKHLAVL